MRPGRRNVLAPERAAAFGRRIADAIADACHPRGVLATSVSEMGALAVLAMSSPSVPVPFDTSGVARVEPALDADALVVRLFEEEGRHLVRLVRLFVDDRNAAEDLVQEGFIRFSRNVGRIRDERKAAAYLRSIVLNLARDQNRRGLVSLRHHLPFDDLRASTEDEIVLRDDQQEVIDALRELPHRQRNCLVLRYYEEQGIDEIAESLDISRNSVKTHLQRGLAALERILEHGRAETSAEVTS